MHDINQVSPLHLAAAHGNVDIGYLLYDSDAKLDAIDKVYDKYWLKQILIIIKSA